MFNKNGFKMKKIVFANCGAGKQGKSSSVKEVYHLLNSKYKAKMLIDGADVKATFLINGVLVGLESQGDPYSRMFQSLDDFVSMGCDIIVCACRSSGGTRRKVQSLANLGYQIVWAQNDRTEDSTLYSHLNNMYARKIVDLILDRIAGKF